MTVVATSLTRSLIETHLVPAPVKGRVPAPGSDVALRVDHMVMDEGAASLVFQAFETCDLPRVAADLALACVESPAGPPMFESGDERWYVRSAAAHFGVHYSPAGNGRAHHVHGARHASPGRVVLTCASGGTAAGAIGSMALAVSELELAAALAGVPHRTRVPDVWAIRLAGNFPPGVGAHDLVMSLAGTLPGAGARAVALEFCGPGVATLDQEARFTVARLAATLGLPGVVFPSDERTRTWLEAQGREPDWRPLAGVAEADATRVIDVQLDALEPRAVRTVEGADPLLARDVSGLPIRRVVLGADAGLSDLLAVAESVGGGFIAPGVELIVVPGSRQLRAALGASGALEALTGAGVRVLDAEARIAPGPESGVVLLCGAGSAASGRARTAFRVGPGIAAASALSGRVADPRELPPATLSFTMPERLPPCEVIAARPAAGEAVAPIERGSAIRPLPSLPPMVATLRGVVLQRFPDRVRTDRVLPDGPRVWRHRSDAAALADHLYAGLDPGFASRARALGGGFVVAGARYGVGPRRPHAAMAMVALGVRVVIADSFDPGHRAELVRHGVMPLCPPPDMGPAELAVGDDLEIPGLPEMLERSKPLIVRNLTRGHQLALHHDLSEPEIEMVRAGGLLAAGVRAGAMS